MSAAIRPSRRYIPEDLRDEDLYRTSTELIDAVRRRPKVDLLHELDEIVTDLLPGHESRRAVLAYYNMFVRPSLGTKAAMLYVLRLLDIDARLIEWFDADFNLPSYKFVLDFAEFPDDLNIDRLIDLVDRVKNERSRLAVIRQAEGFQDLLRLNNGRLNNHLLSAVSGEEYRGINVFLVRHHRGRTVGPEVGVAGVHSQYISQVVRSRQPPMQLGGYRLNTRADDFATSTVQSSIVDKLTDISDVVKTRRDRRVQPDDFFTLGRSRLGGWDFMGVGVRMPIGHMSDSNYRRGLLNDDLYLNGVRYVDEFVTWRRHKSNTQGLHQLIQPRAYSASSTLHTRYVEPTVAITSRTEISTIKETTTVIPRFGIGVPIGGIFEYKPSAYTSHRSE